MQRMLSLNHATCTFVSDQTPTPTPPNAVNVVTSSSQTQTSADDLIISQLQTIIQLFSSFPPSGEACIVSELNIQPDRDFKSRNLYYSLLLCDQ